MNMSEARTILDAVLAAYRARLYSDLRARIGKPATGVIAARSGAVYQIEVQVFWDDKPDGNIRVLGSIDDGGLRAFVPLCAGFIIAPDGRFVGKPESN